jgi:hypothetical protein
MIHETLPIADKRKMKIMQCSSIKSSPFSYGSDFFSFKKNYYTFVVKKC